MLITKIAHHNKFKLNTIIIPQTHPQNMKAQLFAFFLLLMATMINAQRQEYTWDYITFEEPYRYLSLDTSDSNIWEIGTPQKQIFNGSYAGMSSAFTDGKPYYPVNNHSSFTLTINERNMDHYPYSVYFEFMHRLDTEEGKDGGYIDVSYDGGESWVNIIDDRSACFCPGDQIETVGLYTRDETLYNGISGFSGQISFWSKVRFGWEYCLAKSATGYKDSMLLRFNFISDGNDTSREGWNIDHIRLFSMPLTGSTETDQGPVFSITPNPTRDQVIVRMADGSPVRRITLFDMTGAYLGTFDGAGKISLSGYSPGVYFLKIESEAGMAFRKVLKQ